MKKSYINLFILLFVSTSLWAQQQKFPGFIPSYDRFSSKKPAKLGLQNGTILEGTIKDLDRKKGLIEEIEIKPLKKGKKQTLVPETIQYAYLEPSGLDKLGAINDNLARVNKVSGYDLDSDLIRKGYVYFESSETQIRRKKKETVLLQLLNPTFTGRIRIYDDPFAKSTMAIGVAGLTVAGGDEKSFFYKKDDSIAQRLFKKDFDDEKIFTQLFGDCQPVLDYVKSNNLRWHHLNEYVFIYNNECAK